LEESSKASLRFDEFPTNVARRKSVKIRVQHAYWLEKRKRSSESRRRFPKKLARKDSAVCVSLSSHHNVKEPFEKRGKKPRSRTPDGSKSPIRSQRQPVIP
jgi:hypothetical protein